MLSFRLAVRALAWRAAASVTVFIVALIGITAAAVGPIYLHAVDDAVLADRLTHAPQSLRDVHIVQDTTIGINDVDWHAAVTALSGQAANPRWFDAPVFSETAPAVWTGQRDYDTELAAIDGLCAHVRVTAGRCLPGGAVAETVVTTRTARRQHIRVGQTLEPVPGGNSAKVPLRVVGVVTPIDPHGTFWSPWPYLNASDSLFPTRLPQLDAFFVSHRWLGTHLTDIPQTISANLQLRAADIRLDDLDALRAHLRAVQTAAAHTRAVSTVSVPVVKSGLPGVLDAMRKEMSLARTLVILPTAQLVVLAIVLLYAVIAGSAEASGPEVALAKLRGRRSRSVLTQGLAPPVLLVVVAAPIAALIAWLVVKLVARELLGSAVAVPFPAVAVEVVVAATATAILAAVIAARRILVTPVGQLLRRTDTAPGSSIGLVLLDAATVALAIAGMVELAAAGPLDGTEANPLAAVAAILLSAGIAVLVVRALPLLGRALVRLSRESPRVAVFLAVRQIVRRPLGARVIVPLGVALSLATFAVIMWSSAAANRHERALAQAGAPTVLLVHARPDVTDLRVAVDRADPDGHAVAAAIVRLARTTPVLAVDTTRFRGVGAWSRPDSAADLSTILTRLRAATRPSVVLPGPGLRLAVDTTQLPAGKRATLSLTLTGADHLDTGVTFGPLHAGAATFHADVARCTAPCRVTGLSLSVAHPAKGEQLAATISASAASTTGGWHAVPGFADPARWQQHGYGVLRLGTAGTALSVHAQQSAPDIPWPALTSADTPADLPAVIAKVTATLYNATSIHDVAAFGLDAEPIDLDGTDVAVSLPMLDRQGAMVDFGTALNAMHGQLGAQTQLAVFVGASAPSDLVARLAAQGVQVQRTIRASTFATRLDHTGPAFADGLFLVAACVAALLAIGAAVRAGLASARQRSYELAALDAAGVSRGALRRSVAVEQGVLLLVGLAVGLVAGIVAAHLALPKTPVFVTTDVGPPVRSELPYGLIALLAGAVLVVFAVTSAVLARFIVRRATAARLREGAT